jgi:hypothetical protein
LSNEEEERYFDQQAHQNVYGPQAGASKQWCLVIIGANAVVAKRTGDRCLWLWYFMPNMRAFPNALALWHDVAQDKLLNQTPKSNEKGFRTWGWYRSPLPPLLRKLRSWVASRQQTATAAACAFSLFLFFVGKL